MIEKAIFEFQPYPIHWLAGGAGIIPAIGLGWVGFRYRGDIILLSIPG